ncbi:MAG: M24 family metallopeptidase [Bacteroidetes bacterium]|nr:M24 family metallopeptidase [Bacteroidota bacterium]
MRYQPLPSGFFTANRKRLSSKLPAGSLAIVNANDEMPRSGDQCFPLRQNADLYYLTGLEQEKCILILCPDHPVERLREVIFTVYPDESLVTWYGYKYSKQEITDLSGVKQVQWLSDFDAVLKELMGHARKVYLNANEYPKFFTEVPYRDLRFTEKIKKEYPLHTMDRLAPLITSMRLIKQKEEIGMISKACDITEKAFRRILGFIKPGVMEYEIEAEITHEFLRHGVTSHAYPPIIASGKEACILHYNTNDRKCKDGDLVLLDFGAEYGNYASDLTRTIPVNGKFSKRQRQVYDAVLRVHKAAKKLIIPGTTIDEINGKVAKMIEKELIGLGLFSSADVKKQKPESPLYFKYYMHGNSHFLGLDTHDVGTKQTVLKPGMVLSCEPAIYIKEEGIGIRIETDVLVTKKEPIDLMAGIPIEASQIEKLMRRS